MASMYFVGWSEWGENAQEISIYTGKSTYVCEPGEVVDGIEREEGKVLGVRVAFHYARL